MADKIVMGGMSHQQVALELVRDLVAVNQRKVANKDAILDLYDECLQAVYGHRKPSKAAAIV